MPEPTPSPAASPTPTPLVPTPEFLAQAAALGVVFDPGDVERLGLFLAMLLDANQKFNLTAITEPGAAWQRHILDALTLVPIVVELGDGARVIDVGTGGGVPGVPLAIVMPGVHVTLLEATGKKCAFLREVINTLGLKNCVVLEGRAEHIGQDHHLHREKYDVAIARAVGPLAVIAELCVPLVKQGGVVLAIKGQKADEELEAARAAIGLLGARHEETLDTPTGRVVVLSKQSRTPRDYPRHDGEPKRSPLGIVKEDSKEPSARAVRQARKSSGK